MVPPMLRHASWFSMIVCVPICVDYLLTCFVPLQATQTEHALTRDKMRELMAKLKRLRPHRHLVRAPKLALGEGTQTRPHRHLVRAPKLGRTGTW